VDGRPPKTKFGTTIESGDKPRSWRQKQTSIRYEEYMGNIYWDWKRLKDISLYGSQAYETSTDFDSESDAKSAMKEYFASQECAKCGSRDLSGNNIKVEITRVQLYKTVDKTGFFGGKKQVEERWKVVQRVGSLQFPEAHIFSSGGHYKCRKCGHRMGSLGFFAQWAANIAKGG
jgi:hypothetical protein